MAAAAATPDGRCWPLLIVDSRCYCMQMEPMDQMQMRNQIARLEQRLEDLAAALEKSRKAILASKVCIAGGGLLMLALVLGIIGAQPLAIVVSIAAILGGIVGFGANVSTARQDRAAMEAVTAARTELISRLEMRDIGQGTSLSFYQ
jgi:hypothetical protein